MFQNITFWGGGVDLWGKSHSQPSYASDSFFSDSTVVNGAEEETIRRSGHTQEKFKQQSMCDGIIECVGFTSMLHMGQVQTGLTEGIKICQGR